jgi:hypothetical protein
MVDDASHPANGGQMVSTERSSSPNNNSDGKGTKSVQSQCPNLHIDIGFTRVNKKSVDSFLIEKKEGSKNYK